MWTKAFGLYYIANFFLSFFISVGLHVSSAVEYSAFAINVSKKWPVTFLIDSEKSESFI